MSQSPRLLHLNRKPGRLSRLSLSFAAILAGFAGPGCMIDESVDTFDESIVDDAEIAAVFDEEVGELTAYDADGALSDNANEADSEALAVAGADELGGVLVSERVAALSRCPAYTPRPRNQKIDYDTRIDGLKFVNAFRNSVGDNGMGYVVVLQNDQRRNVATDTYGWAISPCDPEGAQPWTVDTATKIGSVSKLITTAAVINASEKQLLRLEGSIAGAMPARWRLHRDFYGLKWSEILGHRAGFRFSTKVSHRERLAQRLDNDPARGDWKYSNALGIAGVLLYGEVADFALDAFDRYYANRSIEEHDEAFNRLAQSHYILWSKREVLDPAGARLATCRLQDAKDAGRPFARSYTDKADPFGAMGKDNSLSCPSGGWQMSARGLMRFLRTLRHTDNIITDISYRNMTSMFRDINGTSKPYLGFDGRDRGYTGGDAFDKNGSIQNYKTYVAMLPHGYTLVAMSNSGDLGTGALERAAKDAWNAAYK